MTRKSRRELERAVDDLDGDSDDGESDGPTIVLPPEVTEEWDRDDPPETDLFEFPEWGDP